MPRPEISQAQVEYGWVQDSLTDEFPLLRLRWVNVAGPARQSPSFVRDRLYHLSDAISAPRAVSLRQTSVAEAYRVFARQIGLDPEADRGPLEQALVQRIHDGEFRSEGLPADACLIAMIDTGVPVWVLDAETLVGALGVCTVQPGELLGRGPKASPVATDRLAVADLTGPLGLLLSPPDATVAPGKRTDAMVLYAIGAAGVPDLVVDEALWMAAGIMASR